MPQDHQQNFNAMRQDAIRRSREMQRRAGMRSSAAMPSAPAQEKPASAPAAPSPSAGSLLPGELQNLMKGWDGERLALLGLLYILYKDGADAKLLLAIAYILL